MPRRRTRTENKVKVDTTSPMANMSNASEVKVDKTSPMATMSNEIEVKVDKTSPMATMSNAGKVKVQTVQQPQLAQHDSTVLDLAFALDCTCSMGTYIQTAQQNIRQIVEQIVASEKSDIRMALVEYRDHPPQDRTFVTRTHDFTKSITTMKNWLEKCSANGGGDFPEAVADALHDVLKLSWRDNSTKICVLISDAPPHGLIRSGDKFPNGCPLGIDPMVVVQQLAAQSITLYVAGCEPSITPYKDVFAAMAYLTGGQYVPLVNANLLTQVIIGGAQEEISLEQLMADVDMEVRAELRDAGGAWDEDRQSRRVQETLQQKGAQAKQLQGNDRGLGAPSSRAMVFTAYTKLSDVKKKFEKMTESTAFDIRRKRRPRSSGSRSIATKVKCAKKRKMSHSRSRSRSRSPEIECDEDAMVSVDEYRAVEGTVQMEQAQRMVQKWKMRNQDLVRD